MLDQHSLSIYKEGRDSWCSVVFALKVHVQWNKWAASAIDRYMQYIQLYIFLISISFFICAFVFKFRA